LFEVPARVIALGRKVHAATKADPDSFVRHAHRGLVRHVNYSATTCRSLAEAAPVAFRMLTGREDFHALVGAPAATMPARSLTWDPNDQAWLQARLPQTWRATRSKG
jgi:hypothetical protein